MADGEWRRTVHCKDGFGRDRSLTVTFSSDGQLMLGIPAGEAAILDLVSGGDELKRHIDEAQRTGAERLMGLRPLGPALVGELQDASTFYVLDREERQQRLGVGLHGSRVAFNGPRGFWQADEPTAVLIGAKVLSLAQILRQR